MLYAMPLTERKGVFDLINALCVDEDVLCDAIITGKGEDEDRELLQTMAARCTEGRKQRIVFPGQVSSEDLRSLLAGCLALVVPSHCEELAPPCVPLALAQGKPVIAAKHSVLEKWIVNGVNGYLHEPGSPRDLANCIRRVRDMSDTDYADICRGARESAEAFRADAYADRVLQAIGDLTGLETGL